MMSTPELAAHLREVCGPPRHWRELDPAAVDMTDAIGRGTEIYDEIDSSQPPSLSDVEFDFDDHDDDLFIAEHPERGEIFSDQRARRERAPTSITNLTRLKDLELTSMINIANLDKNAGAQPLVDLDELASVDQPIDHSEIPPDEGSSVDFGSAIEFDYSSNRLNPVESDHEDRQRREEAEDDDFDDLEDHDEGVTAAPKPSRNRRRPWLILVVILLAGLGVAVAIGLSGPKLGKSAPEQTTPGR
jgi:hypothetical protein